MRVMHLVQPLMTLDCAAVLRVVQEIDGDGSLTLDPEHVIARGLPMRFVQAHAETVRAGELTVQFQPFAGPDTRVSAVRSLALLRAIAAHYRLTPPVACSDPDRNARVLSEIITAHLEHRAPRVEGWRYWPVKA